MRKWQIFLNFSAEGGSGKYSLISVHKVRFQVQQATTKQRSTMWFMGVLVYGRPTLSSTTARKTAIPKSSVKDVLRM
jgi:hypothetical protein